MYSIRVPLYGFKDIIVIFQHIFTTSCNFSLTAQSYDITKSFSKNYIVFVSHLIGVITCISVSVGNVDMDKYGHLFLTLHKTEIEHSHLELVTSFETSKSLKTA